MKISVSYGKTINLGNYESLRLDASMEVDTTSADYNQEYARAWEEVRKQVDNQTIKGGR